MKLIDREPDHSLKRVVIGHEIDRRFVGPEPEIKGLWSNEELGKVFKYEKLHSIIEIYGNQVMQNPNALRWVLSDVASRIETEGSIEDYLNKMEFDIDDTERVAGGKDRMNYLRGLSPEEQNFIEGLQFRFKQTWRKINEIEDRDFMERYYGRAEIQTMTREFGIIPRIENVA